MATQFEIAVRKRFVREALAAGTSPNTLIPALQEKFGISRSSAYNLTKEVGAQILRDQTDGTN